MKNIPKSSKKQFSILVNTATFLSFLVTLSTAVPQELKVNFFFKITLILFITCGGILLFPILQNWFQSGSRLYRSIKHLFILIPFGLMIFIVASITNSGESSKIPPANNISVISNKISYDSTFIRVQNRNISQEFSNHNHIINGDHNNVGVNGDVTYNVFKPLQRILNKNDLKLILSSITSKNIRVRVNYPSDNNEALHFGNQIFSKLIQLGYFNLSKAELETSMSYFGSGRITIRKDSLPFPAINIIINPQ